ncbi:acyl transferase/acyl hydrolase/lysophospholipase [Daldinia grandis]|nr:acyl transferase/acyl hydrolase/lysophospholipase [Daldinia grandis]
MTTPAIQPSPLRILSLDGGGIRGKSSLLILENIMEGIRKEKGLDQAPRPCDCFDIIGGTSTGGIIAIMLGRLGLTVDECIRAYDKVGKVAFTPKWTRFPIAPPKGAYSAQALESVMKQMVMEFCTEEPCRTRRREGQSTVKSCAHSNLKFRDVSCTRTVALGITKDNVDAPPTLFRTYDTPPHLQDCAIWEISRATSAATTFFKSIKLGRDNIEFIDAGFGYNNPCEVLINEAKRLFPERDVLQILSIGTGLGDVVTIKNTRRSIIGALKRMARSSNMVARRLDEKYSNSGEYYRFNVDRGLEVITLSDWEKTCTISAHTNNYLSENQRHINQFVRRFVHGPPDQMAVPEDGEFRCHAHFHVPFAINKRFVGRGAILSRLKHSIFKERCQKIALVGLGGVGKTQVALQLAYWARENEPEYSIFWVPAQSYATFEQAYQDMARKLAIKSPEEDIRNVMRDYLSSERAGKWLIIVDNADDLDLIFGLNSRGLMGISQYLPRSANGHILFTTRFRQVAQSWAENDVIEITEMNLEESLDLLDKSFDRQSQQWDATIATELVGELSYLPLAIKQAAAYLNITKLPISTYLSLLRNTEQDMTALMSKEFHDSSRYLTSHNAAATTWLVSFDQIRKIDSAATNLLEFISQIEPKAIPRSLLPRFRLEEQLDSALGTLCAYAFLTRQDEAGTFDMHRLVHLGSRIWTERNGNKRQIIHDVIAHTEKIFPSGRDSRQRGLWRAYLPHALKALHESSGYDSLERYILSSNAGRCLQEDLRNKEAIRILEEVSRWGRQTLNECDPARLTLQITLASAYTLDKRTKESIQILEHVVNMLRETCPRHDSRLLLSEYELAKAYYRAGRPVEEPARLLEHVVAHRREKYPNTMERWDSESMLSAVYHRGGQVRESIEIAQRRLIEEEKSLPEDHYDRLNIRRWLGISYLENNQVELAIELFEHIVSVQKALAEDHADRLYSETWLGKAYVWGGRINEAIEMFEHVVKVQQALTEDNIDRLTSEEWLSCVYYNDGRYSKVIPLLEHLTNVGRVLLENDKERLWVEECLVSVRKGLEGYDDVSCLEEWLEYAYDSRVNNKAKGQSMLTCQQT